MARVHMFKSSSDKQTKTVLEELPASPSLALDNTTSEENALDVTASPKQSQAMSLKSRNESAALTAALLQKASSNMMVAEAVAAALAAKPGKNSTSLRPRNVKTNICLGEINRFSRYEHPAAVTIVATATRYRAKEDDCRR
jgi:hypothetical protein